MQSANKRAHRKCNGCGTVLHSCTVVSGTAHLAFGDEADAKGVDLAALLAETFD